MDSEEHVLSDRLEGIVDALVTRTAVLLASGSGKRMLPSEMDELRALARLAVRGAAIEGARGGTITHRALIGQKDRQTDPGWNETISERIHLKKTVKASPDDVR